MSVLLERANQTLSITDMSRSTKDIMKKLSSGEQDRYVIMKNNSPAAVLMNINFYEALMDELDDLRIELVARNRLQNFDARQAISHEDMLAKFDINPS